MREPNTPQQGSRGERSSRAETIKALLILGVLSALLALLMSYQWLDTQKQQWVACEVIGAEPQRGSSYNSVAWFVSIETTDCGFIAFSEGTTEDNVHQIADSFEPGGYELKLGMMSRLQIAIKDTPFARAAAAKDYRRLE